MVVLTHQTMVILCSGLGSSLLQACRSAGTLDEPTGSIAGTATGLADDAHATILSLLGLDHRKLTYLFQGREQRLTDIGGDNDLAERLLRG